MEPNQLLHLLLHALLLFHQDIRNKSGKLTKQETTLIFWTDVFLKCSEHANFLYSAVNELNEKT